MLSSVTGSGDEPDSLGDVMQGQGAKPFDEERTTPTGLFHFAESYRTCAEALLRNRPPSLRFEDPAHFLAYHALELYLKAFLRHRGESLRALRYDYGHSLEKLWDRAEGHGLVVGMDPRPLLIILDAGGLMAHRYIRTGAYRRADETELLDFLDHVRSHVVLKLSAGGLPVRLEGQAETGWPRTTPACLRAEME